MKPVYKGILLAALQVALVCTLGAKLLYDRAHRPRIWIKAAIFDPELPVRGRYLSLNVGPPRPIRLGVKKDGVLTPLPDVR